MHTDSLGYFKTKHGGWDAGRDTFYFFHGGLNSNDREGTSSYSTSGNPLGDQVAVGRIVRADLPWIQSLAVLDDRAFRASKSGALSGHDAFADLLRSPGAREVLGLNDDS